jgi:hypothetical protein
MTSTSSSRSNAYRMNILHDQIDILSKIVKNQSQIIENLQKMNEIDEKRLRLLENRVFGVVGEEEET